MSDFLLEIVDGVATVTLSRPAKKNALSVDLMRALTHCARDLAERHDVDAVLLTGGTTVFSAGADLQDARRWADETLPLAQRRDIAATGYRLCKAWEELPQISIAAIEGYAIGGGLALSLACDWRVAADNAFVSLPEIALGIPLTWGTVPRLVNLAGPAKAKRLTILCERISSQDALSMGILDYVVAPGMALAKAQTLAQTVRAMPQTAVRMSKESVNAHALALNHISGYMAHDQIALAAGSEESKAARAKALRKGA
jgi:enoyl-CoA hydratase